MYVKDVVDNFKKKYGKNWEKRYFAWQGANPGQTKKALKTAQGRGDKIVSSLAKTKKGKAKARKELNGK